MTDDLKDKFERLVADPPPPSAVPSEAVFAKVRSVRRRRTAGVATLAAAAAVAVAVAAGNLTDINSSPPVTNTPSAPVTTVTAPPTTTPTKTPSGTTTSGPTTGAAHTPKSNTPPPASTSSHTPDAPPLGLHVSLKPTVQGLNVSMKVTLSGTVLVPTGLVPRREQLSTDTDFLDLQGGTQYFFGDGEQSGSDAGAVDCLSGTDRITRHQTYSLHNGTNGPGTYTYAKAGTYTFKYTIRYCGANGWVPVTKTAKVTVK